MDDFRFYRRDLPHWRKPGSIYFATFRLADSIPQSIIYEWRYERDVWLAAHGIHPGMPEKEFESRYKEIDEPLRVAFEREQARKYFCELDKGHGECLLRRPAAATLVAEALRFFDRDRLRCGDFVVMPNHVHWLLLPLEGHEHEDILQSVKRYTASRINRLLGRAGRFWQKESHDHIVRDRDELVRIQKYIANSPGAAHLGEDGWLHWEGEIQY